MRLGTSRSRRLLAGAGLAVGAVLATVLPGSPGLAADAAPARAAGAPAGAPLATAPTPDQPAGQVLLGVVGGTVPVKSSTRLQTFQAQAGRQMATLRVYALWDSVWPDAFSNDAKAHGQMVVLSVKSKTTAGRAVSWRAIADSQPGDAYDLRIRQWAQAVSAYGAPVMFTFNHEPEVYKSDAMGTAADYVAAWRHIVTLFRQEGVRNAEYVFIGTAFGWRRTDARATAAYYPGDDFVDDIAADGYNWFTCRPRARLDWVSPQVLFEPFRQFGLLHPAKGLVIGEFGSVEDPAVPGRKAQWLRDLQAMVKQPGYGQFRAVAEYYGAGAPGACNWRIDTSPDTQAAFQAWGADPQFTSTGVAPATVRLVRASTDPVPTSATVGWAPAGPGGSPVLSYTVTVLETGESFTLDGAASSLTYQPPATLPAGAATYTFSVSATNAAGTSQPSGTASALIAR